MKTVFNIIILLLFMAVPFSSVSAAPSSYTCGRSSISNADISSKEKRLSFRAEEYSGKLNERKATVTHYVRFRPALHGCSYVQGGYLANLNGHLILTASAPNDYNQQWSYENGYIINRGSGKVLTAESVSGSSVIKLKNKIEPADPSHGQQWIVTHLGNVIVDWQIITSTDLISIQVGIPSSSYFACPYIFDGFLYPTLITTDSFAAFFVKHVTDTQQSSLSLSEKENSVSVYPNPVKHGENLTINLPVEDRYQLTVFNPEGLTVSSQNVKGGKISISTTNMRSGIYFYKAAGTSRKISGKFSVQ